MPNDTKDTLLDRLRKLLGKPDAPAPAPAPVPDEKPNTPSPSYLKALLALRNIQLRKLTPLLFTVPVIVFLAISGAVAWLAIGLGVVIRILRFVAGL
jgi:hypothetical protein